MTQQPLNIGLVAHDAMKETLSRWVQKNKPELRPHQFYATGTTHAVLSTAHPDLKFHALKSGPLGGDQQLGALICEGKLDCLIFFQDPMTAQPHDVDVKALVRMSTLYDVALACNPMTADLIISSPAFSHVILRQTDKTAGHWDSYLSRQIPTKKQTRPATHGADRAEN